MHYSTRQNLIYEMYYYTIILYIIGILLSLGGCVSKEEMQREAVALYKIGKFYEEKEWADSAAIYYSKAYQLSKKSSNDSLIGAIGNSFGHILQLQNLYKNAQQIHKESFNYNNKLLDKTAASTSLRAIGKGYLYNTNVSDSIYKSQMDSAIKYFSQASTLIPQIKSQEEISLIYNNLSLYYSVDEQHEKALDYNTKSIQFCKDSANQYRNYFSRADIYFSLHQTDSAIYYCNRGIKSKNIYVRCATYYRLADIYSLLGAADSAKYMKLARTLHDSIEGQKYREEILQTIHANKLEKVKHQKEQNTLLIILIILVIASSAFFIYRKYFHKRITIQQKELNAQKRQTKALEQKLQESQQIKNYAELKASKQSEEEKITAQLILLGKESSVRFMKTAIYKEVNNKVTLSNEERAELSHIIFTEFHAYIQEISKYIQLAEEDYLVCCLSILGCSTKQCAICRGVGEAAIRVQRKRIKEKLKTFFHSQKLCNSIFEKN